MHTPTPELWERLSIAFERGNKAEAVLLVMQLFPGRGNDELVCACVEAGDLARQNYDLYSAEAYYRLAVTLYDRCCFDAHKDGIAAVKHLIHVLEAQSCADEAWLVVRQTEDLCIRAASSLTKQIADMHRSLSA